ncbi:SDR family oxidoreductase [Jidongwangia harbinensis]|uniref:SDR family oxidoreductase n=1 Tax=Jidongwangia harbinensis TaxID=2878561 RepID=UPI001CD990FE|nr:SDR family oxidoreductase [Jidongwangia harbinensis]MCA2211579.1 SDR family oxidoreductase [Jidongwangia harbinensis]
MGEHRDAQAGDRLWVAMLDVTRPDDVRARVDEAFAHFGTVDVVVNKAGYGLFADGSFVLDNDPEAIVRAMMAGDRVVGAQNLSGGGEPAAPAGDAAGRPVTGWFSGGRRRTA